MIQNIMPKYYFYTANGMIIKNLNELPDALERIDNSTFNIHVTQEKNDFADWISGVFKIYDLSAKLREVDTKEETIRILRAYLRSGYTIQHMNAQEAQPLEKSAESEQKTSQNTDEQKTYLWTSKNLQTEKAHAKETDADAYFEKNPELISQVIDSKKKTLSLKPLQKVTYTGKETHQELIELFRNTYANAYQRLSELRKAGYDTSLAELMLFRIPPKIKLFSATKDNKDAAIIKRYLNEIIEELNSIK